MARVRVLFPTAWDRQQLQARREVWAGDYEISFEPPDDADCPGDLDVLGFIERALRDFSGRTDGVFSASDYPGAAVAAAVGTGLGLPSSEPAAVLRAAHKALAREVQAAVLPAATPPFQVIDPDRVGPTELTVPFPAWVKPAKGCYSVLARRASSAVEVQRLLADPRVRTYRERYLRIHRQLVARYLGPDVDGRSFLVEGELRGGLVTVEGFATGDDVQVLGVVDSVVDERTGSFVGFEYPSSLPEPVQARMEEIAVRLGKAFGLRWTMFNVELTWDAANDHIGIVELNPRMCGQFADLWEKVDGVHGYRLALDLACGVAPTVRRRSGQYACAATVPLRLFEPARVLRVPDPGDLAAAAAMFAGTLVWNEIRAGEALHDFAEEDDGRSYRYAVINVGGSTRAELMARCAAVRDRLGYRFERMR